MSLNIAHNAIRIDNSADPNNPERHAPSVTVDNQSGANGPVIIVAWYEKTTAGPEYVVHRRLQIPSSTSVIWLDSNPVRVNDPLSAPAGVNRAAFPSVATDANNNFVVAWQANVNNPTPTPNWNAFGKSYNANATPTPLKRDFRIDLAGRSSAAAPRVTRSSLAAKFASAWRDNRSGHYDVYTRVVPSM